MRLVFVALALSLFACKTKEKRAPSDETPGPPVAASCDYKAELLDGTSHSCTEIYDPSRVDEHEAWCNELKGPRDHPTFARGKACSREARKGGCLYPNGTIAWRYAGRRSCIGGLEFADAPTIAAATLYRCMTGRLCTEIPSVFDLTKTVEKKNCETAGGTFEAASCASENAVGRCATRNRSHDTTWVYYSPTFTVETAKQHCEAMPGTFSP